MKRPFQPTETVDTDESDMLDLVSQFNCPRFLKVKGQQIEVRDVQGKGVAKDAVPVAFLPGFCETPEAFRDTILHLAARMRRVVAINYSHGMNTTAFQRFEKTHPQNMQAETVVRALDAMRIDRVHTNGHSQGAVVQTIAGLRHPDRFEHFVYHNPAGMIGKHTILGSVWGAIRDDCQGIFFHLRNCQSEPGCRQRSTQAGREAMVYFYRDVQASCREVAALARTPIEQDIAELQSKHGKLVALLIGMFDRLYPVSDMQQRAEQAGIPKQHWHVLEHNHCGHLPYPVETARTLDTALTRLELERV